MTENQQPTTSNFPRNRNNNNRTRPINKPQAPRINNNFKRTARPQEQTKRDEVVFAFIDSQNVNLSVQDKGWKLDWTAFRRYLKDKLNVSKAFLFVGYMPGNETMYSALQQQGYILIFKPTVDTKEGIKGNVDVEIVLRAMIEYPNYDKAVIATGDGDFRALIDHLGQNNKLKALIIPNKNRFSSLFKRYEESAIYISDLKRTLAYTHRAPAAKIE